MSAHKRVPLKTEDSRRDATEVGETEEEQLPTSRSLVSHRHPSYRSTEKKSSTRSAVVAEVDTVLRAVKKASTMSIKKSDMILSRVTRYVRKVKYPANYFANVAHDNKDAADCIDNKSSRDGEDIAVEQQEKVLIEHVRTRVPGMTQGDGRHVDLFAASFYAGSRVFHGYEGGKEAAHLVEMTLPGHGREENAKKPSALHGEVFEDADLKGADLVHMDQHIVDVAGKETGAKGAHTLFLSNQGTVYAIGDNSKGQLDKAKHEDFFKLKVDHADYMESDRDTETRAQTQPATCTPKSLTRCHLLLQRNRIIQVACGVGHSVCVTASGKAISFGNNNYGQLGHFVSKKSSRVVRETCQPPRYVSNLNTEFLIKAVCSDVSTVLLTKTGKVFGCGSLLNSAHQPPPSSSPMRKGRRKREREKSDELKAPVSQVKGCLFGVPVTDVAAGSGHVLAVSLTGEVFAWGVGRFGELGVDPRDLNQTDFYTEQPLKLIDAFHRSQHPHCCKIWKVAANRSTSLAFSLCGNVFGCGKISLSKPEELKRSFLIDQPEIIEDFLNNSCIYRPLCFQVPALLSSQEQSETKKNLEFIVDGSPGSEDLLASRFLLSSGRVITLRHFASRQEPSSTLKNVVPTNDAFKISTSGEVSYVFINRNQNKAPMAPFVYSAEHKVSNFSKQRLELYLSQLLSTKGPEESPQMKSRRGQKILALLQDCFFDVYGLNLSFKTSRVLASPDLLRAAGKQKLVSDFGLAELIESCGCTRSQPDQGTETMKKGPNIRQDHASPFLRLDISSAISIFKQLVTEATSLDPTSMLLLRGVLASFTKKIRDCLSVFSGYEQIEGLLLFLLLPLPELCPDEYEIVLLLLLKTPSYARKLIYSLIETLDETMFRIHLVKPVIQCIQRRISISSYTPTLYDFCVLAHKLHAIHTTKETRGEYGLVSADDFVVTTGTENDDNIVTAVVGFYHQWKRVLQVENSKSMFQQGLDRFSLHQRRRDDTTKRVEFLFFEFPFLMDSKLKRKLFNLETNESMWRQTVATMVSKKVPYFLLKTTRDSNYIIETTIQYLLINKTEMRKPLRVIFKGEEGIDAGGVKKEFFEILSSKMFSPDFGMLKENQQTKQMWFNCNNPELLNPKTIVVRSRSMRMINEPEMQGEQVEDLFDEKELEFILLGALMGLALYNDTLLDVNFPPLFYRILLDTYPSVSELSVDDLHEIDPQLASTLNMVLDGDSASEIEAMSLYFELDFEAFGEIRTVELVPNGSNLQVTLENKQEYVRRIVRFYLHDAIKDMKRALLKGFNLLIPRDLPVLRLLSPRNLELMIIGENDLQLQKLKEKVKYVRYDASDRAILHLWEALGEFTESEKKLFLKFLTGSTRVPFGGLAEVELTIQKDSEEGERLPSAQTCFFVLRLPNYQTKDQLKRKLLQAILNSEGFHLS